jgi:hypothetical protein
LLEIDIRKGLTASQRLLLLTFLGYLTVELPPSFPSVPLLQRFHDIPNALTSFTKQHLKQSFRLLFIHNMQNSAGAEWTTHLAQMAQRDKQFSFLKKVKSLSQSHPLTPTLSQSFLSPLLSRCHSLLLLLSLNHSLSLSLIWQ